MFALMGVSCGENGKVFCTDDDNIAVIYHYQATKANEQKYIEHSKVLFKKAAQYWKKAISLAPNNYIEAQNWLKTNALY